MALVPGAGPLTLAASQQKGEQEGRTVRVVVRDGVALEQEDDLPPGRLNLTVCEGVVVAVRMDGETED